jgi:hypothetical protein
MKGKLIKIEERWMVGTVCYADLWSNYIPLHPDDESLWMFAELNEEWKDKLDGKEVEFEIVQFIKECKGLSENCFMESPAFNCGCQQNYAKLIPSKEQQKQLITEIMDLDAKDGLYDTVNDTVNKMAEESWEGCDGCDENDKYFWMSGFRAGYFRVIPDEISDEEIEKAWISYKRECLEKFEKDTTIAGYAITNKEKFAKWYREQLKQRK